MIKGMRFHICFQIGPGNLLMFGADNKINNRASRSKFLLLMAQKPNENVTLLFLKCSSTSFGYPSVIFRSDPLLCLYLSSN
jgi:hypothetical protein